MGRTPIRLSILAVALVVSVLSAAVVGASPVASPFVTGGGTEDGPGSGSWGDGSSGPSGMHIGCIRGRRFAVLITVHNQTNQTVTLVGGGGPQSFPRIIERVAVQVRVAPPPPKGDLAVVGLRSWSPRNSAPVAIPAERDGWVQSNFLMRDCSRLRGIEPVTVNRTITLSYKVGSQTGRQVVSAPAARIILTRGPVHPRVPINQVG
jgi:hypothetical protein